MTLDSTPYQMSIHHRWMSYLRIYVSCMNEIDKKRPHHRVNDVVQIYMPSSFTQTAVQFQFTLHK